MSGTLWCPQLYRYVAPEISYTNIFCQLGLGVRYLGLENPFANILCHLGWGVHYFHSFIPCIYHKYNILQHKMEILWD